MSTNVTDLGDSAANRAATIVVSPGDAVDRYIVEEVLGSGGMGVVVAARHATLGHRVAMKFIGLAASADADAFIRFTREAQIIATVQSDHVVRVTDFGTHQGSPYMVMDLLSGRDLRRELELRGPLPVEEAIDYVIEACDGLSAVHEKGIVHRDVKLANLFLETRASGERVIKVVDFGVSKLRTSDDDVNLTNTSARIGSPLYMSPEQTRDARTVDARADVWSLGVVLQKLLTGEAPFHGLNSSALCAAIAADPPIALRSTTPHLPRELETIVLRCLEKNPSRRYPSAVSLARDLAPFASAHGKIVAERLVARVPVDDAPLASPPSQAHATTALVDLEKTAAGSVVDEVTPAPHSRKTVLWGGVLFIAVVVATLGLLRKPAAVSSMAPPVVVSNGSTAPAMESAANATATSAAPVAAATTAPPTDPMHEDRSARHRPHTPNAKPAAPTHAVTAPVAAPSTSAAHFGGSALDDHL